MSFVNSNGTNNSVSIMIIAIPFPAQIGENAVKDCVGLINGNNLENLSNKVNLLLLKNMKITKTEQEYRIRVMPFSNQNALLLLSDVNNHGSSLSSN